MDEIDEKIIKFLQEDGRMNYSEIASKLKLANATVHARIIKLKREGVLHAFTIKINTKKIGKPFGFILSLAANHEKDNPGETKNKLKTLTDLKQVFCVTGEWDYHLVFYTKDVETMKEIVTEEIKKIIPVLRSSTQIILDESEYPIKVK